jgi:hypothetical protein
MEKGGVAAGDGRRYAGSEDVPRCRRDLQDQTARGGHHQTEPGVGSAASRRSYSPSRERLAGDDETRADSAPTVIVAPSRLATPPISATSKIADPDEPGQLSGSSTHTMNPSSPALSHVIRKTATSLAGPPVEKLRDTDRAYVRPRISRGGPTRHRPKGLPMRESAGKVRRYAMISAISAGQTTTDERRRNLWPLPGGVMGYSGTVQQILRLANDHPSRPLLEERVHECFVQVRSPSTSRGYVGVLVTLGLLDRDRERRMAPTGDGMRFARTDDQSILATALVERVVGVREVLEVLIARPMAFPDLLEEIDCVGLHWDNAMALRYRVWWLRAVGAQWSLNEWCTRYRVPTVSRQPESISY